MFLFTYIATLKWRSQSAARGECPLLPPSRPYCKLYEQLLYTTQRLGGCGRNY